MLGKKIANLPLLKVSFVFLLLLMVGLSACGQKGPLKEPGSAPEQQA